MRRESKLRFTREEQDAEETPGAEDLLIQRFSNNPASRWQQRRTIRKKYAQARHAGQTGQRTAAVTEGAKNAAAQAAERAVEIAQRHRSGLIVVSLLLALAVLLGGIVASCSALLQGGLATLGSTTYPSADEDMLAAEAAYAAKEAELQAYLDDYEWNHSYDEYHYDLDEIKHDPYVLISLLTALHGGIWTLSDVEPTLDLLFERQYTLDVDVDRETRYDSEDEPYGYYTAYVTLENFDLSHLPVYLLDEEQLSAYANYMRTLGNRPDLFPGEAFPNASQRTDYQHYDVPPEALSDERFAAMLHEAEKYLGYPYVWGGSSPSTSFDCSGFVSWVINHSGWNVGRLGATGLYNICTPVSPANARPGDLVFFQGTYDTPGMSHVGIYVGGGMMLHCGNPISYTNLNSAYWQLHFAAFGRLP